jgi:hypothetical protein
MNLHREDSGKNEVAKDAIAIAAGNDRDRAAKFATLFGGFVKRIASILNGVTLAVLFFVVSAHAQSDGRISANIPFDFTVGTISLPAGQYEFIETGDNIVQVRNADRRTVFALSTAPIEANGVSDKSTLKFAAVDGRHVLVQIWNELTDSGAEFTPSHSAVELAEPSTMQTITERR